MIDKTQAKDTLTKNNRGGVIRSSNLELLRIICMIAIVAHHYVVNSGLLSSDGPVLTQDPVSGKSIYLLLFGMWGKTAMNCFVLITGYFMCTSGIKMRKFIKLYLWIIFYGITIKVIFIAMGKTSLSPSSLFLLFPFRFVHTDNFVSSFLVWWLFIPFLNKIVNDIKLEQHIILILLMLFCFSALPCLSIVFPKYFRLDTNPICWFSTIYFIAAFIRMYPEKMKVKSSFWKWASAIVIFFSMCCVISLQIVGYRIGKFLHPYCLLADCERPLALIVSVALFTAVLNIRVPYNKFINLVGASTFGVLLIHANSNTMIRWLWVDTIDCVGRYSLPFVQLIGYSTLSVLAIFTICIIIDIFRIKLLEEPFFRWYDNKHFAQS